MLGEVPTQTAAFTGVAMLALVAPFETTSPLVRLPAQSISSLEAAIAVACLLAALAIVARGLRDAPRPPIAAPWLAFFAACLVAALASPISRSNALHMTGRIGAAFAIFMTTVAAANTPARARTIAALLVASGVAVAALAILEYLNIAAVLQLLTAFRPGITTVGAQLRAGGPLQYPTIASMYLEIVFAIGTGLLVIAVDRGDRRRTLLLIATLLLVSEAIALTYTRAGLISLAATLAIAMTIRIRTRGFDAGARTLSALAVAVAALFLASRSTESLWLRLTSEGQESWYRADITAPARLVLGDGDVAAVAVKVTNTGRLVWDSTAQPPFYFSYHWLSDSGTAVVAFDGLRTAFEAPVRPGDTVALTAHVRAPQQPGPYRLVWDVVQEGRLWFSTEPGALLAASEANVSGSGRRGAALFMLAPLPKPTVRPGRVQLWRAALAIAGAHPIVGIGPDNFRLAYGSYAGIAAPDLRTHSNNMYFEVLTGTGLLGASAFVWLLWSIGRSVDAANLGAVCALVAIALHGLVDSFLSFAPTYVVFGVILGLACGCPRAAETSPDACCV